MKKNQKKDFWYLDHQGIRGLEFERKEFSRKDRASENGSLKGKKLGLKFAVKAMGEIFGSERAKSYALYSASSGRHGSPDKGMEQTLNRVMNYLAGQDALVSVAEIDELLGIEETALPAFCTAGLQFLLDTKFYLESSMARTVTQGDKDGIIELIMKNKFVVLRADQGGSSLRRPRWQRITMGAGLGKWASVYLNEKGNPEFGKPSALDTLLRTSIDTPVRLNFFGHVIKAGTSLYIKPFAIW